MIDAHCHILPGRDDGVQTMDEALEMAQKAVASGITHILCTPHHNNGYFNNKSSDVIVAVAQLQEQLTAAEIPLILFEGQEVRLSDDLMALYHQGQLLGTDLEDRYMLVELPSDDIPDYTFGVFQELLEGGITPVIVHPERHDFFVSDPNQLVPFLRMGVLTQMTAPSYTGQFGKTIEKTAELMLEHGMIHMLASDAHNITTRPFLLREAYEKLEENFGVEKVNKFERTAKAVINGDRVIPGRFRQVQKRFFGLF
ncbi:tyrosine-protein phosphatase [Vagococcus elongatus]|uniref:Tyrosine-protein phosphatase n=1 Tax=Vagococcus elongatus TaxID=180344 RepID=A0A430B4N6_9ENTE|nr:CpsB/CapC family capsule biosynthesis tyrosine phosphatase [Vagococcus elongatus]RSU15284.1 tyrosine protein phosphatase [Vagococcus elongatus]